MPLLNPLHSESMSAAERHAEVATLLARGFLRSRTRAVDCREKGLAFLRASSDSWSEPSSEGEKE